MSKSVKSTKSFSELVNVKIEPIVQSDWVLKVNSKGKLDKRFFVSTYSALYICQTTGLWQKLKFKHIYPWVDLEKISSTVPNNLLFQFDSKTVKIQIEEARTWITPTLNFLSQFFPENHGAKIEIPQSKEQLDYSALAPSETQFIDLFISCCLSLDVRPDPRWCSITRKSLRNDESLNLLDIEFNPKIIAALCRALSLMRNVPHVIIGGYKFLSLYGSLSVILQSNPTIEELTIVDSITSDGFLSFCKSIENSGLEALNFDNVTLTEEMIMMLSSVKLSDHIHELEFRRCNLQDNALLAFFTHAHSFKGLEILEFSRDSRVLSDSNIKRLFKFVSDAQIDILILKEMNLDIVNILTVMVENEYDIKTLNLSKNYCSDIGRTDLLFPAALSELILKNVKWNGNSFAQFLSLMPFQSTVKVDFSSARFQDDAPMDPFRKLADKPKTNFLESINFKHNVISTKLFEFLTQSTFIHEAFFDSCTILPEDENTILTAISDFISSEKLTKLSLASTLRSYKEAGIAHLKGALSDHCYLKSFNYSNNAIGDRGLMILKDILLTNETITKLNFSGANLFDPTTFLDFIKAISKLTTLAHVTKPKRDIAFLLSRSNKTLETEINDLWKHLSENTERNAKMNNIDMTQSMNSGFLSAIDSSSLFEASSVTYIEASWDLTIDINYPNPANDWEKLQKRFTFEKITGCPKPAIQDMSNTDPFNLIEFDPL